MAWWMLAAAAVSAVSAKKEGSKARRAQGRALGFEQQRYEDYKAIYGDIEKDLGEFYKGLTEENVAALGLQAHEQEIDRVETQVKQTLAQRNIEGAGLEAGLEQRLEIARAEGRAKIRTEAPFKVAEAKTAFVRGKADVGQQFGQTLRQNAQFRQGRADTAFSSFGRILGAGARQYALNQQPSVPTAAGGTTTGVGTAGSASIQPIQETNPALA